ncbi:MAG: LPXTG cell wall anchor domain-containing protein, partial [Bacillota bacterium]
PTPDESEETNEPTDNDDTQAETDKVIGLSQAPVVVSQGETVVIDSLDTSIKMPNDLPAGTTMTVDTYNEETFTAESGTTLNVSGEIITVNLSFPDGSEGYEGEFELTLGVNADAENPAVYYLGEDGWELRGGDYDEENGVIRLIVSGFSTYGVFEAEVDSATGETLPNTSTMMFNWSMIGATLLLMSGGLFYLGKRKQLTRR